MRGLLILCDYPWCSRKIILFSGLFLLCFNTPVTSTVCVESLPFVSLFLPVPSWPLGFFSLSAKSTLDIYRVKLSEDLNTHLLTFIHE